MSSGKKNGRTRDVVELRLYIAGQTPKSLLAISNLKKLCKDDGDRKYRIRVIDLLKKPTLARQHQIVAIPTLVRSLPIPIGKVIGDLSDKERVLVVLELRSSKVKSAS